jgi:hypothetical protein
MSQVRIDLYREFSPKFQKELYECVYDAANAIHYRNEKRSKGDISVPMSETVNARLGIEPDFDYELTIIEGSDNWPEVVSPKLAHEEVKAILDARAEEMSSILVANFCGESHGIMENSGLATGWATYVGNPKLRVPENYSKGIARIRE